jgi:4-hydroxybenzoate polyprenyltransferase
VVGVRAYGVASRVVSTSLARTPARGLALIPALLGLVRFAHTIFALPFALAGAVFAQMAWPSAGRFAWIGVAMVGARSLAMALNRLIDHRIDARNPRTAGRELPSGRLTPTQVVIFAAVSLAALVASTSQLAEPTRYLWPVPVAMFWIYPYVKRVSWTCHLVLGLTIGLAPVGAWLAVTGEVTWATIALGLAVACWIAGFDIVYALLDVDFDVAHGVHSIPARFGARRALWFTRALHLAAGLLLVAVGIGVDARWPYFFGVALCAAVLVVENMIIRSGRPDRINAAFSHANIALSVIFAATVVAEVALR